MRTRVLTAWQDLVESLLKLGGEVKVEMAKREIKVSQLKSGGYIVHTLERPLEVGMGSAVGMQTDP